MDFVDEIGLYLLYIVCKKKNAIRFQDWLHEKLLLPLYEQRKALAGLGKDDILLIESDRNRLRRMS